MQLHTMLKFAREYRNLGDAVTEQLNDVMKGNDSPNPNAVRLICDRLGDYSDEIRTACEEWLNRYAPTSAKE